MSSRNRIEQPRYRYLKYKPKKGAYINILEAHEEELAFQAWSRRYEHDKRDSIYEERTQNSPQRKDWLSQVRRRLLLSRDSVASTLNVSNSAVEKMERLEKAGRVSLKTMEDYANAMGCEFVYMVRPRGRKSIARTIWDKLFPISRDAPFRGGYNHAVRYDSYAMLVQTLLLQAEIRRSLGLVKTWLDSEQDQW